MSGGEDETLESADSILRAETMTMKEQDKFIKDIKANIYKMRNPKPLEVIFCAFELVLLVLGIYTYTNEVLDPDQLNVFFQDSGDSPYSNKIVGGCTFSNSNLYSIYFSWLFMC